MLTAGKFLAAERGAFDGDEASGQEEHSVDPREGAPAARFPLIEIAHMDALTRLVLREVYQQAC